MANAKGKPKPKPTAKQLKAKADSAAKKRATEGERLERIHKVKKLILTGTVRADILQYGASEWKLGPRSVDTMLAAAKELIGHECEKEGLGTLKWHIAARLNIINRCMSIADHATALRSIDSLAKLQNLFPAEKLEIDDSKTVARERWEERKRIEGLK